MPDPVHPRRPAVPILAMLAGLLGAWVLPPASDVAWAQGQDSASSSAQSGAGGQRGVVEIGAGATSSSITTGSSGPRPPANPNATVPPLRASFSLTPPSDPFFGPASLPIAERPALRCEVIDHAAARTRCEASRTTPARPATGAAAPGRPTP